MRPRHDTRWQGPAMALAVTAMLAAGGWPASPAAADGPAREPRLVNEELVTSTLGLSGLPLKSELVNRVVARDYPVTTLSDPTSTIGLRYLDRPGAPPVSNGAAQITVGGPGETSVLTGATFGKPLPVALHVEYSRGERVLDPDAVAGSDGDLAIQYTVTNTAVSREGVAYQDSAGRRYRDEDPVFVPFAGTLVATLDRGVALVSAPGALVSTTPEGATQLLWNLMMAPPLGSYQRIVTAQVRGTDLQVPAVVMQLLPTTTSDDPSAAFSASLLDSSVTGNTALTGGLTTVNDSAISLAAGAGGLAQGLAALDSAAAALSSQVSGPLVDGAQQVATGTSQLASGQAALAAGVSSEAAGAASLDDGLTALVRGLTSIDEGLAGLASSAGLPAAQAAAARLQAAVMAIADAVGSPSDPPVPFPPSDDVTLIQALRGAQAGTVGLTDGSTQITARLASATATLAAASADIAAAATSAGTAAAGAGSLYAAVCGASPTLTVTQCAALQSVQTSAASAAASAAKAGAETGGARVDVGLARAGSQGVTAGLLVLTSALGKVEASLEAVSLGLLSGDPADPGVYEGLAELSAALETSVIAVAALATGSTEALDAARALDAGAGALTGGLDRTSAGADALAEQGGVLAAGATAEAQGTSQAADSLDTIARGVGDASDGGGDLAAAANTLQRDGTARVRAEVVESSKKPAQARSYLAATDLQAADAMPYGPPEGALGRVAYVATLTPPPLPVGGPATTALVGVLFVGGLALLAVARVRRVRSARP